MDGKTFSLVLASFLFAVLLPAYANAGSGCSPSHSECGTNPVDDCDMRISSHTYILSGGSFPRGFNVCNQLVNVWCNGLPVTGSNVPGSSGFNMSGYGYNSINNCTISDYAVGVYIDDNFDTGGSYGGTFLNSISANVFRNNLEAGLKTASVDVLDVNHNLFENNGLTAIDAFAATRSSIHNNTIRNTRGSAIIVRGIYAVGSVNRVGYQNLIYNNTISNNSDRGILIANNLWGFIRDNLILNTGPGRVADPTSNGEAIDLYTNTIYITIKNNIISGNPLGIYMHSENNLGGVPDSTSNQVFNNTITGNQYGIIVAQTPTYHNNVSYNQIVSNTAQGLVLSDNTTDNTIQSNRISLNGMSGILLRNLPTGIGGHNYITYNEVDNNGINGIHLLDAQLQAIRTNTVCFNGFLDFSVQNSTSGPGHNNKCDRPDGWNDDSHPGCTRACTTNGTIQWAYFNASCYEGIVRVHWATLAEPDTVGFYVYRSSSATGGFAPISRLIEAQGPNYQYEYQDFPPDRRPYWYEIVEQTSTGQGGVTLPPFTTLFAWCDPHETNKPQVNSSKISGGNGEAGSEQTGTAQSNYLAKGSGGENRQAEGNQIAGVIGLIAILAVALGYFFSSRRQSSHSHKT